MVDKQQVLSLVEQKGPVIPNEIRKVVGSDTLTIGAILSELSSAGKVRITDTKLGSSPFYYVPSQVPKLQNLVKHLNEKDQRVCELLKSKKVLNDRKQEMLSRVSLRKIKDFARMLEVKTKDGIEIYWKWYLVTNEEAEKLIIKDLGGRPKAQPKAAVKKEVKQQKSKDDKKVEKTAKPKKEIPKSKFHEEVIAFFEKSRIKIIEEKVVRKNSEIDFTIKVPGSVGYQEYYCKAKSKKKCNDGDLSSAYIKGQSKKLPVIFITTGELTKKAENMLEEDFKGMMVKNI